MKPRFFIIIGIIILVVIIAVAAASSSGGKKPLPQGIKVCTVASDVGIQTVRITNQNDGTSIIKDAASLPYSFNCTSGDTLQYTVTTTDGYIWNAWTFNDGTFDNHNPLIIRVTDSFTATAHFITAPPE